jgi:hypothetical protein
MISESGIRFSDKIMVNRKDRDGQVGVRGAGALGKQPDRQKATTSRNKAGVAFCVDDALQAQSSGADAPRQAQ